MLISIPVASARTSCATAPAQVLPPLLVELRNEALQALVLPLVLGIIPQQDEPDFMDWTLPSLLPIATSAKVRGAPNCCRSPVWSACSASMTLLHVEQQGNREHTLGPALCSCPEQLC